MKDRLLTCIVCPRGCALTVHFDEAGKPTSVEGNACKRGVVYAEKECTHPERTVTTTVPKEKVFEVMAEINKATAKMPVRIGDVIIENVAGTGVKVVATADLA